MVNINGPLDVRKGDERDRYGNFYGLRIVAQHQIYTGECNSVNPLHNIQIIQSKIGCSFSCRTEDGQPKTECRQLEAVVFYPISIEQLLLSLVLRSFIFDGGQVQEDTQQFTTNCMSKLNWGRLLLFAYSLRDTIGYLGNV